MARKRTIPVEKLAQTQENRNKALQMRLAGHSQAEIARITGWSKQTVSDYIKQAIAGITRENAEEYLEIELSRLDAMLAAIWPDIIAGAKGAEWKIDRALAIMEQRAKLTGTYKAAELQAIAAAKGNVAEDAISMVGSLVAALDTYAKGKALEQAEIEDDHSDDTAEAE